VWVLTFAGDGFYPGSRQQLAIRGDSLVGATSNLRFSVNWQADAHGQLPNFRFMDATGDEGIWQPSDRAGVLYWRHIICFELLCLLRILCAGTLQVELMTDEGLEEKTDGDWKKRLIGTGRKD